ncbi:hypothetical protein V8F20_005011 [Naviculisporaceae sp. PSN 640]
MTGEPTVAKPFWHFVFAALGNLVGFTPISPLFTSLVSRVNFTKTNKHPQFTYLMNISDFHNICMDIKTHYNLPTLSFCYSILAAFLLSRELHARSCRSWIGSKKRLLHISSPYLLRYILTLIDSIPFASMFLPWT